MASWFDKAKPITKYKVVELEKPSPRLTREDASNIASLAEHPGFHALLNKLKIQKALLETQLKTANHQSLNEVHQLQAGIQWINWIDRQVQQSVGRKESQARDPYDLERLEFERMSAALEFVGKENG